jgi:2',3'-cyclic-nucleotide 2'-phosphodiesterase / 3'-nucleotidase
VERSLPGSDGARHRVRVGVIGFAPPQTALWDRQSLGEDVATHDILEAARAEVPRLRAAGADLVVALCHSGLGPEAAEPLMENAVVPLCALPGIDAVVAGHTHVTFPGRGTASAAVDPATGTVHGKPVVQPGFFGSHVGVIDLRLRRDAAGRWEVARHDVRAERVARRGEGIVASAPIDNEVAAIAAPSHQRLIEVARRPVGRTEVALQSYFSLVAPDATLDVVADAQRAYAACLLEGTPEAALPLLTAVTPFKTGGRSGPRHYIDVRPGPLALRQAAELYIHPNTFCVVEASGADLLDWLERSASLFCRLRPGEADQPLLDPGFPSYCFDVLEGLSYAIDPTAPARTDADGAVLDARASRVRDLRHDGRPVRPEDRFAVATNSYRTGAGGGFAAAARARPIAQSPRATRDIVLEHVRRGPLAPQPRAGWRFASLPGTSAWFDTGPGALRHPEEPVGRRVRAVGPAPEGFWRYSLAF